MNDVLKKIDLPTDVQIDQKFVQFPKVDHGINPKGPAVLIMGQYIPELTKSGIALPTEYRKVEGYDIAIGRVEALGPLAYKNKETLAPWLEGNWCEVDQLVSIPRSGTRIRKYIDGQLYTYILVDDTDIGAVLDSLDGFKQFDL